MKKFIIVLLLLFSSIALFGSNGAFLTQAYNIAPGSAFVISSKCDLYSEDSFSSEKVMIEEEIVSLRHGDEVNIKEIVGDFALIEKGEIEGYVFKYYLSQNSSQLVYPVYNGKLRYNTMLYDVNFEKTGTIIKKNTRIFIYDGFNDKEEFTPIQLRLEDDSIFIGYVKTENVKPDGINGLLISAISLIAAAVMVILSLIFIKKKNKKKKKAKALIVNPEN